LRWLGERGSASRREFLEMICGYEEGRRTCRGLVSIRISLLDKVRCRAHGDGGPSE